MLYFLMPKIILLVADISKGEIDHAKCISVSRLLHLILILTDIPNIIFAASMLHIIRNAFYNSINYNVLYYWHYMVMYYRIINIGNMRVYGC